MNLPSQVLYVMLVGAYPFDGLGEPIDAQIRRASVQFPAGRRCCV